MRDSLLSEYSRLMNRIFIRHDSTKALTNRFNEILSNKIDNITYNEYENLAKELKKFEKSNEINELNDFYQRYSNQLNYLKLEKLLNYNKHGKEIYKSRPWDGNESVKEASLRMIIDLKPKPKKMVSKGKRLTMAREMSNEYKDNRDTKDLLKEQREKDDEEDEDFKKLYQERFLGPNMLLNTSNPNVTLNLVNSIASSKINSKINLKTGLFDDENMNKVRGKPLNKNHLSNSTDSSYFINEILNKQQVLPPWVETQQDLNIEINQFRNNLKNLLIKYCKINGIPNNKNQLLTVFKNLNENYSFEKIKLINNRIRDYNLQSPSSNFHKLKLNHLHELKLVVESWYSQLPELIENNEYNIVSTEQGFLSLFDNSRVIAQRPVPKLNLWSSFKQMFTEVKGENRQAKEY